MMGLGAGGALAPRRLWASDAAPKRVIFFYTHHGTWYDGWKIHQGNPSEEHYWEQELPVLPSAYSQALAPLAPFREKMLVVDGLALVSAELDGSGLRHELGQVHSLTGANIELLSGVPLASQPSLDQLIAEQLAAPGQLRSLEYAVGEPAISVNYSGPKGLLPFIRSPITAHQRLFGRTAEGLLEAQLVSKQSELLQASAMHYGQVAQRLGQEGARKLELHQDLLRALSLRVDGLAALRAECQSIPELPMTAGDYEADFDAFIHLLTSAFSCDLSRVATLHMGPLSGAQVLGQAVDLHNDYAHAVWTNEVAQAAMTRYTEQHAEHVAALASLLDGVVDPLGDGAQTLLDNTMIVWVGELGDGAHGFEKWPAVIVGGNAFSSFRYGRYLFHPSHTPVTGWHYLGPLAAMGVPHQHFLVSIAQQLGLARAHVGERNLLLSDGSLYDATGPLLGMT
jgi:hypothetical protein